MPEQPAARACGLERYAPKTAAADVRDAVVSRETLVDERVVGIEQVDDAAILVQDGREQKSRLLRKRLAQILVEVLRDRANRLELPQHEPLRSEVLDECVRLRVGEHAANLALEHVAIAERARGREIQQLSGGHLHLVSAVTENLGDWSVGAGAHRDPSTTAPINKAVVKLSAKGEMKNESAPVIQKI